MKNPSKNRNGYNVKIIWLILFTLTISINFSCSGVRSIRGGYVDMKIESQTNQVEEDAVELPEELTKVLKQEPVQTKTQDYSKLVEVVGDRLPTIREQMQVLAGSQDSIKNEITIIKNDIEQIKHLLSDLKGTVDDFIPAGTRMPITGKPATDLPKAKSLSNNDNGYELLSDEKSKPSVPQNNRQTIAKKAMKETFLQSDEKVQKVKQRPIKEVKTTSEPIPIVEVDNDALILGKELYKKQNYKAAIDKLTQALQSETSKKIESEINYLIGESYYFSSNYEQAIDYFNKVLNVNDSPFMDAARIRKAEANLKSGKISEAKADYQALIKNHPGSSHIPKARKMLQQL